MISWKAQFGQENAHEVLIYGLKSRTDLNGTIGKICGPGTTVERKAVLTKDDEIISKTSF